MIYNPYFKPDSWGKCSNKGESITNTGKGNKTPGKE